MAEFTTLLGGRGLIESPRWMDGRLVFSDWGTGEIVAVDLAGSTEIVGQVDEMPFCLEVLPDGRLVVTAAQQILVQAPGGLQIYADLGDLTGHDYSYNDIVADAHGNLFVNNINFDYGEEMQPGFIALVTPDGGSRRVAEGLAFPNGMAISSDGSTLVVAESHGGVLTAFDITADGSLDRRRVWADLAGAAPDGICFDAEGAIWYAEVPGRRCVRVREGGEVLQEIRSELGCFSCALGGPDGKTLFVTAAGWPDALTPGSRTGKILIAPVDVGAP